MNALLDSLDGHLAALGPSAVALSGGVDSMTLAVLAHRANPGQVEMFHALSPAVPPEATERVRRYAAREGWTLHVFDAGEFADQRYLANPVNRCYFCKSHVYSTITARTDATVLSGTNTDDLGDFRPGLTAAREHQVQHPYVSVGIGKQHIRVIARDLHLTDVADLPAAPCLASRVETGIVIAPDTLLTVHQVERELTTRLDPKAVRCRVRREAVTVELDEDTLAALTPDEQESVLDFVSTAWPQRPVRLEAYRRGSAFLR